LDLSYTPIIKQYSAEQLKKMVPNVKCTIYM
jgi:hypothetical protein